MRLELTIQALQSEGVVDAVIERALVKAELAYVERMVQIKVGRAMHRASENFNPFADGEPPMVKRKVAF